MAKFVALLRGINVGGNKLVSMAALREKFEERGFENVKTLLQSGNVVFEGKGTPAALEKSLATMGFDCDFFVRTSSDIEKIVAANPFPSEAMNDPGRLIVLFLKEARDAAQLRPVIKGREVVKGKGRELYIYYPDGQGTTKLTNAVIEKTLGTRGTARNWNTVVKLLTAETQSSQR